MVSWLKRGKGREGGKKEGKGLNEEGKERKNRK
jgi:hypothetical protein